MREDIALIMNTDPPYGVAYSDEARVAAEHAHGRPQREEKWSKGIENDGVDGEKLQEFLESAIRAAVPHLADNAAFYLWHPMLTQGTFFAAAAAAADILIHRQIIWCKPSLLFGFGDYHWQHELCFYGWRRGHRPKFLGERNQTTIWDMRNETASAKRMHPTQKPVELFARPIENHTEPGDALYEPFAGSGSQFVAAEQAGRRCYGIELEPKYVAVILERLAGMGLEPRLSA
jgi:DNA modification methylase